MRFSVIVPCYNVEQYLDECVESILNQEYKDFELLLIDDGSTDGTSRLCDVWGSKNEKVRVFHKPNGGLSEARNYGIDRSKGDYLIFIDSDDFIRAGSFSAIESRMENEPEIIITRLVEYYDASNVNERDSSMADDIAPYPSMEDAVKWEVCKTYNLWPAQKLILSRKFVNNNKLRFKKGFLHEDIDWTAHILLVGNNYAVCTFPWYYHRMKRSGSITNTIKAKSITDVIIMTKELTLLCENSGHPYREQLEDRIVETLFISINRYGNLKTEDKQIVVEYLKKNEFLLMKAKKVKHRIFAISCKVIGVKKSLDILAIL